MLYINIYFIMCSVLCVLTTCFENKIGSKLKKSRHLFSGNIHLVHKVLVELLNLALKNVILAQENKHKETMWFCQNNGSNTCFYDMKKIVLTSFFSKKDVNTNFRIYTLSVNKLHSAHCSKNTVKICTPMKKGIFTTI